MKYYIIKLFFFIFLLPLTSKATEIIIIKHQEEDVTTVVRKAIENSKEKDIKIIFEKGIYKFLPDYALSRFSFITNHGNGYKRVAFRLEGFNSVTIEGNGSEFIFHSRMAPFQFENCKKIEVSGITIDWDIPFIFEAEVLKVNKSEGWFEVKPFIKGYKWKFNKNDISFPEIDKFNFYGFGHTHCFDPKTKYTFHGSSGLHLDPKKIEKLDNGIYRFYEGLKNFPPVGCIIASKGGKDLNRYAPAFQTLNCSNVIYNKVIVHHALGMGFLFERTENIKILNSGVYTRDGSDRYISSTADATHFANCKGDILIENCRIESMLDDGTNVHGTYVKVDKIIDDNTVIIELQHFQQAGFEFAGVEDEIWFIQQPSPSKSAVNTVVNVKFINDIYSELSFKNKLPKGIKEGAILENKTWNPSFTIRGCKITRHRARNLMIKTPKKVIIENNYFSSDMASIGFRGETINWYESGGVEDISIRNNHFYNCNHGATEQAVLWVSPKLDKSFDQTEIYDRNITFENNLIETFDPRIVIADRLDGLKFIGNTIKQTNDVKRLHTNGAQFELTNCKNIEISNNIYVGQNVKFIKTDKVSKSSLKVGGNRGFGKEVLEQ